MSVLFRISDRSDIQQMQVVWHLVEENKLSNPDLVNDQDVEHYITKKGRGWLGEVEGNVIGFAKISLATG